MSKSVPMKNFVDALGRQFFGRTMTESVAAKTCITCGDSAESFRDTLSRKEYGISGMCQKCQDEIFDPS